MIKFYNAIPDTETTILRKVGFAVLEQLYLMTNLPRTTDVIFNGESDSVPIKNDNILESDLDRPSTIKASSRNLVKVTVDEEQEPGFSQSVPTYRAEEETIFFDPVTNIDLTPSYQTSRLTVGMQIHFSSKKRAMMWVHELNTRIASGCEHTIHLLRYSFYIPEATVAFLQHANDLKEKLAGYDETLDEWITRCGNKRITKMVNHGGKNLTYALGELQTTAYGKFEFGEVPKGNKSDETGFELDLEYVVIFKRPRTIIVTAPTMIHQSILDDRYVNHGKRLSFNPLSLLESAGTVANMFNQDHYSAIPAVWYEDGIRVPWWDIWRPKNFLPYQHRLINLLLILDGTNQALCKLPALNNRYTLNADLMEYITAAGDSVLHHNRCAVKLSLLANERVLVGESLTINSDGEVFITNPVDLRKIYRLVVSFNQALWALSSEEFELLRTHGKACLHILTTLCPHLKKMGIMPTLLEDGSVSAGLLQECIAYMERFLKNMDVTVKNPYWQLITNYTLIADSKLPNAVKDIYNGYVRR